VLLHVASVKATLIATGLLLPVVTLPVWHRLRHLDAPTVDPRRIALLRGDPIFAPLPEAIVEQLAKALEPVALAAGDVLFREGDPGDRYYLVDSGTMLVERTGHDEAIPRGPGLGFGEIALIRGVPRTATLRAETDVSLYAMRGDEFVAAVSGHATSTATADAIIASRLHALRPSLASA
jgi:CRP-like cAMP-binding protein